MSTVSTMSTAKAYPVRINTPKDLEKKEKAISKGVIGKEFKVDYYKYVINERGRVYK